MAMSRKDYELIAQVFNAIREDIYQQYSNSMVLGYEATFLQGMERGLDRAMGGLADALEIDNPKFEHTTFFKACGYNLEAWI